MKPIYFLFLVFFVVFSCKKEDKQEKEIAEVDINYTIERFDSAFANATSSDIPKLKKAFPFMFPKKYKDTFWIKQMQDTLQRELLDETSKTFQDLSKVKKDVTKTFQHLKYYFPEFNTPRVITTTSNVDYRNKVIVTDTIVLIALDTYLGEDHKFYEGIQTFITANLKESQIAIDLTNEYGKRYTFQTKITTLLDDLIYSGKLLYFKDKIVPFKTDAEKIGYTEAQIKWARENEEYIWRYFIDKELLYSTDNKLASRFINPAPFSKFYLQEIDNESPGKIGQYIGWQIVRAYMANNSTTFNQMLSKPAEEIFNNANFKPRK